MSPIDIVPPEILAEIFTAILTPNEDVCVSPDAAPLLVSHVSRKWRDIALSNSSLWASFKILITTTATPHRVPIIQLWLARSSCRPLSFTIWMDPFAHLNPAACEMTWSVFRLLATHAARWQRVTLVLPGSVSQLFAALCTSAAPNLQFASFKLGNWTADDAGDINSLLQHAPAIRSLVWSNRSSWGSWDTPFDSGMERLQVSWNRLTDVLLDTWITLHTALEILEQCITIVKVDLRHFSSSPESVILDADDTPPKDKYSSSSPLRLDCLESLSIYQPKLDDGFSALLDRLLCPKLRHFNFSCRSVETISWPQSSFHNFITRSESSLESLFLEFTGINEEQLIQCLQDSSPTLTRLELYDVRGDICIGDTLLGMLHFHISVLGKTQTVLCPKLHTLIMHRVVDCTDSMLASMLQSRMRAVEYKDAAADVIGMNDDIDTCAQLQVVDALFSKRYQTRNSADMACLRTLPASRRSVL